MGKHDAWASTVLRLLLVLFIFLGTVPFSYAQASDTGGTPISEDHLKAASLFKFPNYVEWPAGSFSAPEAPFVFGVVGADEVADALTRFSVGRTIGNRKIVVKKLPMDEATTGIHALFIGKAERARQPQLLKQLQGHPILLVTETEGALMQGSMINFRVVDDRVRFEVALGPVEHAGLTLNSRILSVALQVLKGTP